MAARFASRLLELLLLLSIALLTFLVLIQPWDFGAANLPLQEGDASPQDFLAPRDIQYESQVLTEEARQAAEREVEPVYAPPEPSVARQQMERLQASLDYIASVLLNPESSTEQKREALRRTPNASFSDEDLGNLLLLTPNRWELVQSEARRVLERAMQNPIRSTDVESQRRNLPSLVSISLTEREASLVVALVSPLITANSFYSPELTEAARQTARQAVQPVIKSYVRGQTIVRRGQVITAADLEALTMLELVEPRDSLALAGAAVLVGALMLIAVLFYRRTQAVTVRRLRGLLVLSLLFLIFLTGARLLLPGHAVLPYLYPLPAFSLLVTALFGLESGVVFSIAISVLAAFGMAADLLPYYLMSSLCGLLALGQARRLGTFLRAAAAIALAGSAVVVAFRLPFREIPWDWLGLVTLAGAAAINGIVSIGLALFLQFLLAQFLDLTTPLQLLELSRPDFPLLRELLNRAPGTYQHSLQVANLAEQAAERIGADGLLTRVGALFHDIGKLSNPLFFIENQPADQLDPHDTMDPVEAAEGIIRHVSEGRKLAIQYRLPRQILAFIEEHHGTLLARYHYNRALEKAGGNAAKVDAARFRYPGPTPASRETAILMLADSVEARARAQRPKSDDDLRAIIQAVLERCQNEGQFVNAPLTHQDLTQIAESFLNTLRGTYHPRLQYPAEPVEGQTQLSFKTALFSSQKPRQKRKQTKTNEP